MKRLALAAIGAYQRRISPALPRRCRYEPTCSAYAARRCAASACCAAHCSAPGGCCAATRSATAALTRSRIASRCGSGRSTPPSTGEDCDVIPVANILQPLIDIADAVLVFFHDDVGLSWGGAIIALTFATRAVLIPLTYKQIKGMRALQALQPQIKEIQQKYKNDRQRMQQEMMRFYQENKVNPFASCIPLLAQLPVFITLFYLLRERPAGRHLRQDARERALAATRRSVPLHPGPTDKAEGGVLITLVVLYVGTQLAAGLVMAISADRSQRMLMFALPLIFVPFIITFPAGLVLYWITTNVWTIGQQYVVQKLIPPPQVPTPAGGEGGEAAPSAAAKEEETALGVGARCPVTRQRRRTSRRESERHRTAGGPPSERRPSSPPVPIRGWNVRLASRIPRVPPHAGASRRQCAACRWHAWRRSEGGRGAGGAGAGAGRASPRRARPRRRGRGQRGRGADRRPWSRAMTTTGC